MVAATDVIITNNDNGKQFNFRGVSLKPKKAQAAIPIPLVNTTAANTILFRLFGQTEVIVFSFAIFNNGLTAGNSGTSIITVEQQMKYLKDEVFTDNFDVDWTLLYEDLYNPGVNGVILELEFDLVKGSPAIRMGTLTFHRGNIGSI